MEHTAILSRRSASIPDGFREVRGPHGWGWVRPESLAWFQEALTQSSSLYSAAREQAAHSGAEGPTLRGRAPVFVLPLGFATLAVRHYFRGGAVASLLGDRYLRLGSLRPFAETLASERIRSLGIPTPRVVAAAVYPVGPFYRGDIATEYISAGVDVGEFLFGVRGADEEPSQRIAALSEAMALIERLGSARMLHPDLNVKNFLVEPGTSPLRVHILDLDRCRHIEGSGEALRDAMERRFRSSLSKWERITGNGLSPAEWEATRHIPMS